MDVSVGYSYFWEGPGIQPGEMFDVEVCPLQTTTYTVTASASGKTYKDTLTIEVVDPVTIGGRVMGAKTICPFETSGVLTLTGYQGNVTEWQRSPGCDGRWISVPASSSPTYEDSLPLEETTCYRALTVFKNCPGVSDSVKIETAHFSPGKVSALQDTICPFTNADFTLSNYSGEIVGWGNEDGFEYGNNTPAFSTNKTFPSEHCATAWIKAPGCPDSTARPSEIACVNVLLPPTNCCIKPLQEWMTCNTDSVFGLYLVGIEPEEVRYWEVSFDGGSTWSRLTNDPFLSPDSMNYVSDTAIAAGVGYRVILDQDTTEICGFRKPPPQPFFVEQKDCTCEIFCNVLCEGHDGIIASFRQSGGPVCDTLVVAEWQTAPMPPDRDCESLFLNWVSTPNTSPDPLAFDPPGSLTDSLCVRAILDRGAAGTDTSRQAPVFMNRLVLSDQSGETGYVSVTPPINCGGDNSGQVSVDLDPADDVGVYT